MRMTARARWLLRLQGYVTVILILAVAGLAAFLGTRYERTFDWTAAQRHTLSASSHSVLANLKGVVNFVAYAREDKNLRQRIKYLVERYQRVKPDITLEFVNPDTAPDRVRSAGIRLDGEIVITYNGRDTHVETHSEQAITNALQGLARGAERWLVFINGHGERDPQGQANHDLGLWGGQLARRGFKVQPLALAQSGVVPDNTAVLVIASPQVDWLPAEVKAVQDYVARGGNLLLLTEPGTQHGLEPLLQQLGVSVQPGTIIDPTTQKLNIEQPAMALVMRYPPHVLTDHFEYLTVFPFAAGLSVKAPQGWDAAPLLETADGAWSETGPIEGNVGFDEGTDIKGPLDIGYALTHSVGEGKDRHGQRVAVIGDGDFLSNSYLGNSGNLELGLRLVTWLSGDDQLIQVPARTSPDQTLDLSRSASILIGFGFLVVVPLLLLAAGGVIWFKRRRR